MEDVIVRMRSDIKGPSLVGKESFRLSYVSNEAKTAQKVTERLASLYIEENLRDRENLATGTNQFLESQLAEAKQRLIEYEKKLEEYQRRYAGQLPSQLSGNLQAIQNAQMQLQAVNESMNRARERRLLIERQLADAQVLPAPGTPETSAGAGASPPTTAQQLQFAQTRLEAIKLQFTPDHPDVRSLERAVRELQARLDEESSRPPTAAAPLTPAEGARQKRIRDLRAELDVVDHQIAVNQTEEEALKKRIGDYQSKVDVVPTRESELVELTRDYSTVQASYNSLLAKQQESKLAANLETRQVGEQFKILDPASLPEKPYNHLLRIQVILGGFIGGLLLGGGLIALHEQRDSSFKTEDDVIRVLTLPVLALVPVLAVEQAGPSRRRRRLFGVLAVLLVVGSAVAVALWRLQS
jgi:polysaccharide chain length determinant protein (PEP-CTERM system associated)